MARAVTFSFEVAGQALFSRTITNLTEVANDFTPLWKEIAAEFHKSEARLFAAEGAFEGKEKWAPYKKSRGLNYSLYQEWKARKFPGRKMLNLYGNLAASLIDPSAPGAVEIITPQGMALGTNLKVGKWCLGLLHQLGTRKMVKRPVIQLSDAQKKRWSKLFSNGFQRKVTTARKGITYVKIYGSGVLGKVGL
jgi:hypothetical protein